MSKKTWCGRRLEGEYLAHLHTTPNQSYVFYLQEFTDNINHNSPGNQDQAIDQ